MGTYWEIGPLRVHPYGLMIGLGLLVGEQVSVWMAKREKVREEWVVEGFWWVAVGGLVGARLYHVIDWWSYYATHPGLIVAVWEGGLGILGGLLGGFLGLILFSRARKQPGWVFLDIASVGVAFGQAVGRFGNYFNHELYGLPTTLPWRIYIPPENRIKPYEGEAYFHPLFMYEAVLLLVLGLVLVELEKRNVFRTGSGSFTGIYLMGYGIIRFSLEGLRIGPWMVGGIPTAQLAASLMIVIGLGCLLVGKGRGNGNKNKLV